MNTKEVTDALVDDIVKKMFNHPDFDFQKTLKTFKSANLYLEVENIVRSIEQLELEQVEDNKHTE